MLFPFLFATAAAATLTVPLPDGCTPVLAGNVVTCGSVTPPPPPPPPPPTGPPTGLGIKLPWPAVSNSRTFINTPSQGGFWEMNMYFITGTTGQAARISALGYSSYPDIFHQWTLYDTNGAVIVTQSAQTSTINVIVGPTIYGPFGMVKAYGLRPNTAYRFLSKAINPDGSQSCPLGTQCNFLVDMNVLTF